MSCPWWCGIIGVHICIFCVFASCVHAARSVSISTPTTTIFGEESIVLTASASGFTNGETLHIKGVFSQPGSSNYFGYSKTIDGSWVKNSETGASQPSVVIGTWDNTLVIKSDFADSGYTGEGEYELKLGYYYTTSSNTLSSVSWSKNSITISISEPNPTATLTPSPTPVLTPTPTFFPSPTKTLVTATPFWTIVPTRFVTSTVSPYTHRVSDILGIDQHGTQSSTIQNATYTSVMEETVSSHKPIPLVFALLFVGVGIALLSCGLAIEKVDIWKKSHK